MTCTCCRSASIWCRRSRRRGTTATDGSRWRRRAAAAAATDRFRRRPLRPSAPPRRCSTSPGSPTRLIHPRASSVRAAALARGNPRAARRGPRGRVPASIAQQIVMRCAVKVLLAASYIPIRGQPQRRGGAVQVGGQRRFEIGERAEVVGGPAVLPGNGERVIPEPAPRIGTSVDSDLMLMFCGFV